MINILKREIRGKTQKHVWHHLCQEKKVSKHWMGSSVTFLKKHIFVPKLTWFYIYHHFVSTAQENDEWWGSQL